MAALAAGAAGSLTWWGWRGERDQSPRALLAMLLFFALLAVLGWLSLTALRRHLALARARTGIYVARHAGLVWALIVWSASSFWFARQEAGDLPWRELLRTAFLYPWVLRLFVSLPFCLYGGLLFVWAVRRSAGPPSGRG
jgi:hypothetical protein